MIGLQPYAPGQQFSCCALLAAHSVLYLNLVGQRQPWGQVGSSLCGGGLGVNTNSSDVELLCCKLALTTYIFAALRVGKNNSMRPKSLKQSLFHIFSRSMIVWCLWKSIFFLQTKPFYIVPWNRHKQNLVALLTCSTQSLSHSKKVGNPPSRIESYLSSYPGYFRDPIDFQWGSRKYPG